MAALLFRTERREIPRPASDALSLFISSSLEGLAGCLYRQPLSLRAPNPPSAMRAQPIAC
jgi:hypothetical protein